MNLQCPYCGWLYNPDEYLPGYFPKEFVPHHSQPDQPGWCPGTEQRPRNAADTQPLLKDRAAEAKP